METIAQRSKFILALLVLFSGLLLVQGCVLPYPEDLRPTLTVAATEFRPTPTGFTDSFGRATPLPPQSDSGEEGAELPSELSGGSPFYAVVFVGAENFLNVRSEPGIDSEIITTLEANATDLQLTGAQQELSGDRWVEIELEGGETGWVSSLYLTQQVPEEAFCRNARIRTLTRDLIAALQQQDFEALSGLINPQRGLFARTDSLGYEVWLPPDSIQSELTSAEPHQWGLDLESGEAISGSFTEFVLDPLEEMAAAEYQQGCNILAPGISLGSGLDTAVWPFELSNLNFLTFFQPSSSGQSGDWRTWAVGVEILDGRPYMTYLVQFRPQQ